MKINHMIVCAEDAEKSARFYIDLLGFEKASDPPGGKGFTLHGVGSDLLVLEFPDIALPNPAHFAFEVDSVSEFSRVIDLAKEMGLDPRSAPARDSARGYGEFERANVKFRNFYVFDPSGCNVEVMVAL